MMIPQERNKILGMVNYKNTNDLIGAFLSGGGDGFSGTSLALSNTRIIGNQIVHFGTVILERDNSSIIFNQTNYSFQTSRLQKSILSLIKDKKFVSVKNVPMGYRGSLADFQKKQ